MRDDARINASLTPGVRETAVRDVREVVLIALTSPSQPSLALGVRESALSDV